MAAFGAINADAAGRSPDFSTPVEASAPADASGAYVYENALRPHGRERSFAIKQADANVCDHDNTENIGSSAFNACMLTRGWRFSHFEPAAPGTYAYSDVLRPHGRERSDAVREAAAKVCDHGDSANIGDEAFNACMLARGWQFAGSVPNSSDSIDDSASNDPSPAVDSGSDGADQTMEMVNEENAVNAANAAAQQTENNAPFVQQ